MTDLLRHVQNELFGNFTRLSSNDIQMIPKNWYTTHNVHLMQRSLMNWIKTEQSVVNEFNVGNAFNHFYDYVFSLSEELMVTGVPDSDSLFDSTFLQNPNNMDLDVCIRYPKSAIGDVAHDFNRESQIYNSCMDQLSQFKPHQLLLEFTDDKHHTVNYKPVTVNTFMKYTDHYLKDLNYTNAKVE